MEETTKVDEIIDPTWLKTVMDERLKSFVESVPHLLATNQGWCVDPEVYAALAKDLSLLVKKVLARAAMFGDYRVTSNAQKRLKKQIIHLRESDISLAWQSIQQDVLD